MAVIITLVGCLCGSKEVCIRACQLFTEEYKEDTLSGTKSCRLEASQRLYKYPGIADGDFFQHLLTFDA